MGSRKSSSVNSSYTIRKEHLLDEDNQDPLLESPLEGSSLGRSKRLAKNSTLYGIHCLEE